MKTFLALFVLFLSFKSFAGIGDVYVCEKDVIDKFGNKPKFILYWNQNSLTKKDQPIEGYTDNSITVDFTVHDPNYFVALFSYREGHLSYSFDGITFMTRYTKKDWTASSNYICEKY